MQRLYKRAEPKEGLPAQTDVLLMNVEYRWDKLFPDPHLGLLSIATFLRENGFSAVFYDTQLDGFTLERFSADLRELQPKVVGITVNSDNVFQVRRLVPVIRNALAEAKVVLGGPHATALPTETLEQTGADVLVRGEGELTMLEVAQVLVRQQGCLEAVKGITYRTSAGIASNPDRPFIEDLDTLPIPDRDLLINPKSYSGNLISGRGCPYGCTFCFEGASGNSYRSVSPERTMREIELLVDHHKYRYFSFADDTFVANPKRARAVCELIERRYGAHPPFGWYCEGRVDILHRNPDLLKAMTRAGMLRLQLGVESGDQQTLDRYNKKIRLEQIEEVVAAAVEADVLSIFVNFIIGGPFETKERVQRSVDFALKLHDLAPGRIECYSTHLTPFPGTQIYREYESNGLKALDLELLNAESMSYPFFESEALDKWELMNQKTAFDVANSRKMESLVERLPKRLIDRHFEAYRTGMKSLWLPFFTNRRGIQRYYATVDGAIFRGFHQVPKEKILDWCPIRVIGPLMSEGRRIVLVAGKKPMRLNEEGTLLYELSSGRRTTREVIETAYRQLGLALPALEVFTRQALEFFAQMDEEYAVIFKEV